MAAAAARRRLGGEASRARLAAAAAAVGCALAARGVDAQPAAGDTASLSDPVYKDGATAQSALPERRCSIFEEGFVEGWSYGANVTDGAIVDPAFPSGGDGSGDASIHVKLQEAGASMEIFKALGGDATGRLRFGAADTPAEALQFYIKGDVAVEELEDVYVVLADSTNAPGIALERRSLADLLAASATPPTWDWRMASMPLFGENSTHTSFDTIYFLSEHAGSEVVFEIDSLQLSGCSTVGSFVVDAGVASLESADAVLAAGDCTGGLTTVEDNTTVFADGVLSFGWEDTSYGASVAYANADGNATATDASVINPAGALRFTAAEGTFGAGATLRISLTDSAQDSANAASVAEFVLGFESVRDPTGTATYRVPLIQLVDLAGFEDDETLDVTFTADPTKVPEDAAFDSVTIIHSAGAASGGAAAAVVIDAMTLAVPKNYSTPSCPAGTPEALPVAAELTFVAEDLSLDDSQLTCISTVAQTCAAALYEVPAIAVQATAAQTAADAFTVRLYVEPAPFVPLPSVSEEQLSECATAPAASCVPALSAESSSSTTAVVFVPTEQSEALLSFDPQPVLRFSLDECGPYNTLSVDGAVQNAGSSATQLSGVATGVDAGALVVCDAASDGSACAAGAPGVSPPGPMVFNPAVEAASAKAIGNPTSGGAIVADAIPQELLDAKAMSVLVWARLDAINGEVAPVVSTYAPTADGESDTGVVVGCFQAGPYGGCEWGVKVSMTGGLEGAYTLLSGVEGVVGEWVLLFATVDASHADRGGAVTVMALRSGPNDQTEQSPAKATIETRTLSAEDASALRVTPGAVTVGAVPAGVGDAPEDTVYFTGAVSEVNIFDRVVPATEITRMADSLFCVRGDTLGVNVTLGEPAAALSTDAFYRVREVALADGAPVEGMFEDRSWSNTNNYYGDSGLPMPSSAASPGSNTTRSMDVELMPWGAMRLHRIASGDVNTSDLVSISILAADEATVESMYVYAGEMSNGAAVGVGAVKLTSIATIAPGVWTTVVVPLKSIGGGGDDIAVHNKDGAVTARFSLGSIALLDSDALMSCPLNEDDAPHGCVAATPSEINSPPPLHIYTDVSLNQGFADASWRAEIDFASETAAREGDNGIEATLQPFGGFKVASTDGKPFPSGVLYMYVRPKAVGGESAGVPSSVFVSLESPVEGIDPVRVALADAVMGDELAFGSWTQVALEIPSTGLFTSIAFTNNQDALIGLDLDAIVVYPDGSAALKAESQRCITIDNKNSVPLAPFVKARSALHVPVDFQVGTAEVRVDLDSVHPSTVDFTLESPSSGARAPLNLAAAAKGQQGTPEEDAPSLIASGIDNHFQGAQSGGLWRLSARAGDHSTGSIQAWQLRLCES